MVTIINDGIIVSSDQIPANVAKKAAVAALTAGYVLFPDSNGLITSDSKLVWDNTNKKLDVTGTLNVANDLNQGGSYLTNSATVNNLQNQYAKYRFNGTSDYINITGSTSLDIQNNITISAWVKGVPYIGSAQGIIGKGQGHVLYFLRLGVSGGSNRIEFVYGNASDYNSLTSTASVDNKLHFITATLDGTTVTVYLDGVNVGTAGQTLSIDSVPADPVRIGIWPNMTYQKLYGEMGNVRIYNRALTATEVKTLYSSATIDNADIGATGTVLTSGTLSIGKRYRIIDWITNDDFTNVGGANVDGTEFIATDTTPTTWTNSSTVMQIGCVLNLDKDSATETMWYDKSGNVNDGTLITPTLINRETHPKIIGGNSTTQDLTLQTTTGVGTTSADMHFLVGNNGGTEAMTILNSGRVGIGTVVPTSVLHVVGIPAYANDAAAGTAGLTAGAIWQVTGTGALMVKQ